MKTKKIYIDALITSMHSHSQHSYPVTQNLAFTTIIHEFGPMYVEFSIFASTLYSYLLGPLELNELLAT